MRVCACVCLLISFNPNIYVFSNITWQNEYIFSIFHFLLDYLLIIIAKYIICLSNLPTSFFGKTILFILFYPFHTIIRYSFKMTIVH